ncbi:hypothetical protein Clacol_001841 [Clathrus columnatus]|uniref:Cyclin N-terminal domain-containing protein n=1 Tax=Clathrus columnatus TaxID=1419009 RepID=A0AAV4ZZ65_9AGAM|nr:hypothetical protein Clacol_001841 [Clathrus columnatus]
MTTLQHRTTILSASSSFPSSTFGQRRSSASLLPNASHNSALLYIVARPVTIEMVKWVAHMFTRTIDVEEGVPVQQQSTALPTPPATPNKPFGKLNSTSIGLPSLEEFIMKLVQRSGAHVATLLTTLIYLERLHAIIPQHTGIPCTRHRVFLATLIVAAKYLNDSGPKNSNWTEYAEWFANSEINLMESQLLSLLDYRLRFTEEDVCKHFAPFMSNLRYDIPIRQSAVLRVIEGSKSRAGETVTKFPLTPSPSVSGFLPRLPAQAQLSSYTHKRFSQGFLTSLLTAAKNHRSWTKCHHLDQKRDSSFSITAGVASPNLRSDQIFLPQIDSSCNLSDLNLTANMNMLTLSSTLSEIRTRLPEEGQKIPAVVKRGEPYCQIPQPIMSQSNVSDAVKSPAGPMLLEPVQQPGPTSPLLFDNSPLESGVNRALPVKDQLRVDGFLRSMFSRGIARPPGLRVSWDEEKPYHGIILPFKDFVPMAPDQPFEPMVRVC